MKKFKHNERGLTSNRTNLLIKKRINACKAKKRTVCAEKETGGSKNTQNRVLTYKFRSSKHSPSSYNGKGSHIKDGKLRGHRHEMQS